MTVTRVIYVISPIITIGYYLLNPLHNPITTNIPHRNAYSLLEDPASKFYKYIANKKLK